MQMNYKSHWNQWNFPLRIPVWDYAINLSPYLTSAVKAKEKRTPQIRHVKSVSFVGHHHGFLLEDKFLTYRKKIATYIHWYFP